MVGQARLQKQLTMRDRDEAPSSLVAHIIDRIVAARTAADLAAAIVPAAFPLGMGHAQLFIRRTRLSPGMGLNAPRAMISLQHDGSQACHSAVRGLTAQAFCEGRVIATDRPGAEPSYCAQVDSEDGRTPSAFVALPLFPPSPIDGATPCVCVGVLRLTRQGNVDFPLPTSTHALAAGVEARALALVAAATVTALGPWPADPNPARTERRGST